MRLNLWESLFGNVVKRRSSSDRSASIHPTNTLRFAPNPVAPDLDLHSLKEDLKNEADQSAPVLRQGPSYVNPDISPTVRITLRPSLTADAKTLQFQPIVFALISNGPSVRICRGEDNSFFGASSFEPGTLKFNTTAISRISHAQIWCEDNSKVYIQDTGSDIAGTFLNGKLLEVADSSVSHAHQIHDQDLIQLGHRGYPEPRSVGVLARVMVEYLLVEGSSEAEITEITSNITFNCLPLCHCAWRALLHRKAIYSLHLTVIDVLNISSAIGRWIPNQPNGSERWDGWDEAEGEVLITVIEQMALKAKPSPAEATLYRSWIRKVVRHTGALPSSFVLTGVAKSGEHPISGGGFADIFMGECDGEKVALKVLRMYGTQKKKKDAFREVAHEALFWKHLDHPNILPFLGISTDASPPHLSLVSPWMPNGNVMQYIEEHPDVDRFPLLAQSASGLTYLHEHDPGLIHGDIKGSNLLIDANGNVRITDFGLISVTETQAFGTSFTVNTERGSVAYMAPELFGTSEVKKNRKTDVYAFGITMLEIITGSPPFRGFGTDVQLVMAVRGGLRPSRPEGSKIVSEELWTLMARCWDSDPSLRPSMRMVEEDLLIIRRPRETLNPPTGFPSLNSFRKLTFYSDQI